VLTSSLEICVFVVDGQALFREAMKAVLENESDLIVVGESWGGRQAIAEAVPARPNVLLIEVESPDSEAIRTIQVIRERLPECRVIALAGEPDEATILAAFESGASGYLVKDCSLGELLNATRAVYRGEAYVPPRLLASLLAMLIKKNRRHEEALRRASRLTPREREILALLADGGDNQAIARTLIISPQTARTHVQNILSKLEVHSRLEAAAFLTQTGIRDVLLDGQSPKPRNGVGRVGGQLDGHLRWDRKLAGSVTG
jgi:two-component system, NarL family, nitrate/nitrite response regulator NarL